MGLGRRVPNREREEERASGTERESATERFSEAESAAAISISYFRLGIELSAIIVRITWTRKTIPCGVCVGS